MKKIRLGKTNMMVTKLGFGGIPIQEVSEDKAVAVVRRSLALGINYIDTGNSYGNSQERIGKAIAGQREGIFIASKSFARGRDEMREELQHSLKSLKVEYIDLYQFHNVSDKKTFDTILGPKGAMMALQEAKKAGQIRHIGISSHQIDIAKEAVKSGHFETIMYPINLVANEAEDELLSLARENDVGVIAMKPLAGGRIKNVNICFKYLWQLPDVVMLPGIKAIREVEEIVQILKKPRMTQAEQKEMQQLREELSPRFCRHCDYCMPCPQGIPVSMVMDYEAITMGFPPDKLYTGHFAEPFEKAAKCDECGECEPKCPYDMPVVSLVTEFARKYHENKKKYEAGLKH